MANTGRSPWDEYAYLSCMDGIAFGCIAAWTTARVRLSLPVLRGAMALGVVAAIAIVVFRKQAAALGVMRAGLDISILEMGIALILMAVARGVGDATLSRGTALLQLAGRCSYAVERIFSEPLNKALRDNYAGRVAGVPESDSA